MLKACTVLALLHAATGDLSLPPAPGTIDPVALEQGWSPEERRWFHHVSQGTATLPIPYDWLLALEEPRLRDPGRLASPEYLARFGFLPSAASAANPGGLPIGFARDTGQQSPVTGAETDAVGFTCAACHTGLIDYEGRQLLVEGGAAMVDLDGFRRALGAAIFYTDCLPGRFDRFADRVLGEDPEPEARRRFEEEFSDVVDFVKGRRKHEDRLAKASVAEGAGRLDAMTRIGNLVFGYQLDERNLEPWRGPVSFPPIWGAPWFDWVQYNGSIHQPMIRNAGEALGVGAPIRFAEPDSFHSTVRVDALSEIEALIAGPRPFAGLQAPRWPEDVLGPIDCAEAERGRHLYDELCAGCHLPPVGSGPLHDERHWTAPNGAGERYLRLRQVRLVALGTDPGQATAMATRLVANEAGGSEAFPLALARVVEATVTRWYDERDIPEADRDRRNGNRENRVRADLSYKARPLDGVWATAPYLHNGSVPNLYELLSPVEERSDTFCVGSRRFDPDSVGFDPTDCEGRFRLVASEPGNSNAGHEFIDRRRQGTIGRGLAPSERLALIEFLKDPQKVTAPVAGRAECDE